MKLFLVIFVMFFCMIVLMAIGIFFKRKPIAGSCGGLGNVGVEKACDCDKPCEKRLEKINNAERTKEQTIQLQKLAHK